MSWMENRKNIVAELKSLVIFALGLLTLVSLFTYWSQDPSGFSHVSTASGVVFRNACGRWGAWIASFLLNYFGAGSFLFPVICFLAAFRVHECAVKQVKTMGVFSLSIGMFLALSALTVFLALQWPHGIYRGSSLLMGGIYGTWLAAQLKQQLNVFGASLMMLLVLSGVVAWLTPLSVFSLIVQVVKGCLKLTFVCVKVMVIYGIPLIFSKIVYAFVGCFRLGNRCLSQRASRSLKHASRSQKTPLLLDQSKKSVQIPECSDSTVVELDSESQQEEFKEIALESQAVTQSSKSRRQREIAIVPRSLGLDLKSEPTFSKTKRGQWLLPTVEFLKMPTHVESNIDRDRLIRHSQILKQKFLDFGIEGEVMAVRPGPVITLYEFKPGPGVKVSRIAALADDLSMALSAQSVRILAPLPGKSVVGIEIPSETREMVYLREFLQHPDFYGSKLAIPVVMGKDIGGQTFLSDLARMPHLLCAGQTGSGKSVFMNGLICSLFYRFTPDELRMILVDPKFIEFRSYQDIPHLLLPVVDDPQQASVALKWAVREMECRYRILAKVGARNLATFNQKVDELGLEAIQELLSQQDPADSVRLGGQDWFEAFETDEKGRPRVGKLPYIVIIIDELADLMMVAKKEVEISIARIAQKARAAGIHLIIATQRPSTDVITGLIKANLPSRVSFQLASFVDSKTILDRSGAERLLGQGDMLFIPPGSSQPQRLHAAFLEDVEIDQITSFLRAQGKPDYRNEILLAEDDESEEDATDGEDDVLLDQGVQLVKSAGQASASFLQRHLKIGYNRAARMIDTMQSRGIVGPQDGARPREVLKR